MDDLIAVLPARLPLTVIGGFLGSGKTTLVNRLLRESGGRRLAVLVNDFGAINIDAALLASSAGDTIALTSGCVCCSIGDDLAAALIRVIETRPPFDGVVVEASGVADPWRIAQIGLAEPALTLEAVIVLVDAASALEQARDALLADTFERQVRAADLLVLNKIDLVSGDALQQLRDWLGAQLPATPRYETRHAALPDALVHGPRPTCGATQRETGEHEHEHEHHDDDAHHAELFASWSAPAPHALSATALRAALRAVPRGVLRLKGLVRTDELGWSELQFAGRHGSLRRAATVPDDSAAALVAIGLRGQLDGAALDAWLAGCAAS